MFLRVDARVSEEKILTVPEKAKQTTADARKTEKWNVSCHRREGMAAMEGR